MAKVIRVEYGGRTYPITIDAPTEEEIAKNPDSFTIVNGKHYRIDGPKQLISQQNSSLQVSSDSSPTSAAAAVAAMNASTRTSSLTPVAPSIASISNAAPSMNPVILPVNGSPISSIKNRIESRLEKPPKRNTPPSMNRINELNNSPNAIAREEAKEEKEKEEKERQKAESDAEYAKTNKTKALLYAIIQTAQQVLKTARDSTNPVTMRNDMIDAVTISNETDDIKKAKNIMKSALEKLENTTENAVALTKRDINNYVTTLMTCMVAVAGWGANPEANNFKNGKNTARAAFKAMNGAPLTDLQSFDIGTLNEQYDSPLGHTAVWHTPAQRIISSMEQLYQSLKDKVILQDMIEALKMSFKAQTNKPYDALLAREGGRQTRRALRKRALRTRKHFRRIE